MKEETPLDQLAQFYEALDAIPTPTIQPKAPDFLGVWSFAFAPIAAALLASGFILLCALGPTSHGAGGSIQIPMDHFAIEEMKSTAPEAITGTHTDRSPTLRRDI